MGVASNVSSSFFAKSSFYLTYAHHSIAIFPCRCCYEICPLLASAVSMTTCILTHVAYALLANAACNVWVPCLCTLPSAACRFHNRWLFFANMIRLNAVLCICRAQACHLLHSQDTTAVAHQPQLWSLPPRQPRPPLAL